MNFTRSRCRLKLHVLSQRKTSLRLPEATQISLRFMLKFNSCSELINVLSAAHKHTHLTKAHSFMASSFTKSQGSISSCLAGDRYIGAALLCTESLLEKGSVRKAVCSLTGSCRMFWERDGWHLNPPLLENSPRSASQSLQDECSSSV